MYFFRTPPTLELWLIHIVFLVYHYCVPVEGFETTTRSSMQAATSAGTAPAKWHLTYTTRGSLHCSGDPETATSGKLSRPATIVPPTKTESGLRQAKSLAYNTPVSDDCLASSVAAISEAVAVALSHPTHFA